MGQERNVGKRACPRRGFSRAYTPKSIVVLVHFRHPYRSSPMSWGPHTYVGQFQFVTHLEQ